MNEVSEIKLTRDVVKHEETMGFLSRVIERSTEATGMIIRIESLSHFFSRKEKRVNNSATLSY